MRTRCKALTPEQIQGTRTYYLPFKRNEATPPRLTLMIRQLAPYRFHVGLAVCSLRDNFDRRIGRRLAWKRLFDPLAGSPQELANLIADRLDAISERRDGSQVLDPQIFRDINQLFNQLEAPPAAEARHE